MSGKIRDINGKSKAVNCKLTLDYKILVSDLTER